MNYELKYTIEDITFVVNEAEKLKLNSVRVTTKKLRQINELLLKLERIYKELEK